MPTKKKQWPCEHITVEEGFPIKDPNFIFYDCCELEKEPVPVGFNWTCCPICQAQRPATKTKGKHA